MEVFTASARALVTPVTMRTSMASHQELIVFLGRLIPGIAAATTATSNCIRYS